MRFLSILKVLILNLFVILLTNQSCSGQDKVVANVMKLVQADKQFSKYRGKEITSKKMPTMFGTKHYYEPLAIFSDASQYCIYIDEKARMGQSAQLWRYEVSLKSDEAKTKDYFDRVIASIKSKIKKEGYTKVKFRDYKPSEGQSGYARYEKKLNDLKDKLTISTSYDGLNFRLEKQNEDKK